MSCLFCAIIAGDEQAYFVLETPEVVGFLDIRPVFKGHVLVLPRSHHETLADLPTSLLEPLFAEIQRLSRALLPALDAHGTFVAMNNTVSQSVPHVHVHVVPRRRKDGLRGFFWPRTTYLDDADAEGYAQRVRDALRQ